MKRRVPIHVLHEWGLFFPYFHFLARVDAVGGDLDFGNASEGE